MYVLYRSTKEGCKELGHFNTFTEAVRALDAERDADSSGSLGIVQEDDMKGRPN